MSGPSNAVVGDLDEPTNVPVTTVPEEILAEEIKMAKYSQTAEYKRIADYMESRIAYFQTYLPDGKPVTKLNAADDSVVAAHWRAANIVIAEFRSVLNEFANAKEAVDLVRPEDSQLV